jgi:hypothetical protein
MFKSTVMLQQSVERAAEWPLLTREHGCRATMLDSREGTRAAFAEFTKQAAARG